MPCSNARCKTQPPKNSPFKECDACVRRQVTLCQCTKGECHVNYYGAVLQHGTDEWRHASDCTCAGCEGQKKACAATLEDDDGTGHPGFCLECDPSCTQPAASARKMFFGQDGADVVLCDAAKKEEAVRDVLTNHLNATPEQLRVATKLATKLVCPPHTLGGFRNGFLL